jgi:hypothetical protein
MPQSNVAETTLDLCHLMRDLEVFACELLIAEEAEGQSAEGRSIGTSQAPLRDRLIRSGVSTQKIETFVTWRQTLAGLACSESRDEDHLAEIAAAEKAGLTLLGELVDHLRARSRQVNAQNLQVRALAA